MDACCACFHVLIAARRVCMDAAALFLSGRPPAAIQCRCAQVSRAAEIGAGFTPPLQPHALRPALRACGAPRWPRTDGYSLSALYCRWDDADH